MQQWMYVVVAAGALVAALYYARAISTLLSENAPDPSERAEARAEELLEQREQRRPSRGTDERENEGGRTGDEASR
jgi:hypothetical protein